MKVLCIGHATYDINCMIDSYPIENGKYDIKEKLEVGGGQAANEACVLAKWGIETYLAAAIGSDTYGEKIKEELDKFGVKTNLLETSFDKSTSTAVVMINKTNGSRTILNISGEDGAPHLKRNEIPLDPDLIMIDGYEYHASVNALNKFPNKISIIDAGKPITEVFELAKLCNYIVCSKEFAETVSGIKVDYQNSLSLLNIYNKLKERYSKSEIIITLEGFGALYAVNNQIKVMPGIKVDVKDTTGAGDIFHGAFAYCILNNFDIEKAVSYANITAGLSCAAVGGRLAIPNLNNVITYYNNKMGVVTNGQTAQPQTQANIQQNVQTPDNMPNPSGTNNVDGSNT